MALAAAERQAQGALDILRAEPAEALPETLRELISSLTSAPASAEAARPAGPGGGAGVPDDQRRLYGARAARPRAPASPWTTPKAATAAPSLPPPLPQPRPRLRRPPHAHPLPTPRAAVLLRMLDSLLRSAPALSAASIPAAVLVHEPALWAYHALRRWPSRDAPTRGAAVSLLEVRTPARPSSPAPGRPGGSCPRRCARSQL